MSSKRISNRLSFISKMAENKYDVVWDLCCDHGVLGLSIAHNDDLCFVNFIDIVPSIINDLKRIVTKLSWLTEDRFSIIQGDARDVRLNETKTNLVIVSGVGGELTIEIIQKIMNNNKGCNIDFIVSPKYQLYAVRNYLLNSNFGLIGESAVVDKGRVYEIIHFSKRSKELIPIVGKMWDKDNIDHSNYICSQVKHYRLKKNDDIASLYEEILKR